MQSLKLLRIEFFAIAVEFSTCRFGYPNHEYLAEITSRSLDTQPPIGQWSVPDSGNIRHR